MSEFESQTIEFESDSSRDDEIAIIGPPVARVGWIPYYGNISEIPESDYKSHRLAKSVLMFPSALSMMFASGNLSDSGSDSNPAPASFSDRTQFLKLIESKNYRAALALDDVELVTTGDGRPLRLTFKSFDEAGYTPIRVELGSHLLTYFDKGDSMADYEIHLAENAVTIDYWLRFRIGKLGELAGFFYTGKMAPWASMKIEYKIDSYGDVSVRFSGSNIPSQSYYVNWKREAVYDMIGNTSDMIDRFMEADGKDAPVRVHLERACRHAAM